MPPVIHHVATTARGWDCLVRVQFGSARAVIWDGASEHRGPVHAGTDAVDQAHEDLLGLVHQLEGLIIAARQSATAGVN